MKPAHKHIMSIGELTADVARKRIKHIHLRITAPAGDVRISAPLRMSLERIRAFALSKIDWIVKHQTRMRRLRILPKIAVDANEIMLWGKAHPIVVSETTGISRVRLQDGTLHVHLRAASPPHKRHALVDAWQRRVMVQTVHRLLDKWEPIMGVEIARVTVQRMKSRWGSCTPSKRRIRLNLELLSRPPELLEYVVVHELCHLFERGHGPRFKAVMDRYLPNWRELRRVLNGTQG